MSKYDPLHQTLLTKKNPIWRVHFDQIEKILGISLPASARKYPAWWSNDETSHSHSRAWLRAGWKTRQVDLHGEAVTFRKITNDASDSRYTQHVQNPPSLYLHDIPQSIMTALTRRAAANDTSTEKEAITLLKKAVKKTDLIKQANSIRAMTPIGQDYDLALLVRQEREKR